MLAYYVERFTTVEINATFYRMPNEKTVAGWASTAPAGIADTEEGTTPAVATADFGYLRLRAVEYSDDDLQRWIATIDRVGVGWSNAYVFFKHEAESTRRALALQNLLLTHG